MGQYKTNMNMSGLSKDGSTLILISSSANEASVKHFHLTQFNVYGLCYSSYYNPLKNICEKCGV